jgi:hypothetical protein
MSLGFLLWAAGDPKLVDAVVAGYRRSVRPDADELARLPGAVLARPLLFDCWSWVTGRSPLADVVSGLDGRRRRAEAIAERAVEAFAGRP